MKLISLELIDGHRWTQMDTLSIAKSGSSPLVPYCLLTNLKSLSPIYLSFQFVLLYKMINVLKTLFLCFVNLSSQTYFSTSGPGGTRPFYFIFYIQLNSHNLPIPNSIKGDQVIGKSCFWHCVFLCVLTWDIRCYTFYKA